VSFCWPSQEIDYRPNPCYGEASLITHTGIIKKRVCEIFKPAYYFSAAELKLFISVPKTSLLLLRNYYYEQDFFKQNLHSNQATSTSSMDNDVSTTGF